MDRPRTLTAALRAAPRPLLVACDLDGTLAPLAPRPEQARLAAGAHEALAALVRGGVPVAVLSGRALHDLRTFELPAGVVLVGSHGLEVDGDPPPTLDPARRERLGALEELGDTAADLALGTWVERKPTGVAVHRRQAVPEPARVAAGWFVEQASRLDGVWVREGHEVVEAGVVASSKADALERLRREQRVTSVVYLGDDRTDEEVFEVLGPGDVGVKVGGGATAAPYRVAGPPAVVALLEQLVTTAASPRPSATPAPRHPPDQP
jgi:trehalose-phosphatase